MRSRTNKLRNFVTSNWQALAIFGALLAVFALLSWFRLGSLPDGYSQTEAAAAHAANDISGLLENPLSAPFTLVTYLAGLIYFGSDPIAPARIAATIFGLLTISTFYWLVRRWHGTQGAVLGTIVLGCSAWFLHTARLGTPEVLMFLLLSLAAASVWLKHTRSRPLIFLAFVLSAALIYTPGMIWFFILGIIWQWKIIVRLFGERLSSMLAGCALLLVLLAPLGWAIYQTPETAKALAGLPSEGWPQITQVLQNIAEIPYQLFYHGPEDAERWLGRLPLLDAFSIVMLLLGAYMYIRHWRLARSKLMGAALLLSTILVGLGGMVTSAIIMPFIYILVAAGMVFMLNRWRRVFPRNIIAEIVAVGLISITVAIVGWYGLRHYFIAWPNAPETKQVFTIRE